MKKRNIQIIKLTLLMLITPLNFNHTPHCIKLDLSLILMSTQSPSPLVLTLGFWTWTRA